MRRFLAVLITLVAALAVLVPPAVAAVAPTKASGGGAITADDASTGALTTLSGPAFSEMAGGEISVGSIVLATPEGFAFGSEPVTVSAAPATTAMRLSASATCDPRGRIVSVTPTSSRITVYVCAPSTTDAPAALAFSGITVRPTAGTPLARGELHLHETSTATVVGLTEGSGGTGLGELSQVPGALASVQVVPGSAQVTVAQQQQFSVTQADQFGNPRNDTVEWSTVEGAGTIDDNGVFTAGSQAGSFANAVTATIGTLSDSADVTLVAGDMDRIELTADADTVPAGQPVQYRVTATDAHGNAVSEVAAELSITDHDGGVVSGADCDSTALTCAATAAGGYLVTARAGDRIDTHSLSVVQSTIERITLSSDTPSIAADEDALFTVTSQDAYGNSSSVDGAQLSIAADDGAAHDGSCDGRRCTATRATAYTVTASLGDLRDTAGLAVTAGKLATLELLGSATATAGNKVTYDASGSDAYGNVVTGLAPKLSIADALGSSAGTHCSGTACASTRAGAFTVTGVVDDVIATIDLHVDPAAAHALVLSPQSPTVFVGEPLQFTAKVVDEFGNARPDAVTWSALAAVGTIDGNGEFVAGTSAAHYERAVTVTSGTLSASTDVAVTAGSVQQLRMSPVDATITAGTSQAYQFVALDEYGSAHDRVVPELSIVDGRTQAPVDGASCDSATGTCTATRAGAYVVRATSGDAVAHATLTVTPGPLAGVSVTPEFGKRMPRGTTRILAHPLDAFGNAISGHSVEFAITRAGSGVGPLQPTLNARTATSGAEVDGLAYVGYTAGVAPGQDEITVTVGGFSATTVVTVGL